MSERGLAFTYVSIARMPGFEEGGPSVLGLSPGVNLFHGPNASGKTSLARAVRALMWPSRAERGWDATGRASLGSFRWVIDLHGTAATYQRDGAPADGSMFPPDLAADRYVLTLHELLDPASSDERIAETILRESAGGFDVDAAARAAGVSAKPQTPQKLSSDYASAKERTAEARSKQQGIIAEEDTLRNLQAELGEAEEARRRCGALAAAIKHAECAVALQKAEQKLAEFNPVIANIRGDELEVLDRVAEELQEQEEEARKAEDTREADHQTIERLRLPEGGVDQRSLEELRGWCSQLNELKAKIEGKEELYRKAKQTSHDSSRRLGAVADPEKLGKVDDGVVQEIEQLALDGTTIRARRESNEILAKWLAVGPPHNTMEALDRALEILNRWLRTPAAREACASNGTKIALSIACAALVGAGAFLGATSHIAYGALAALGLVLVLPVFVRRVAVDERAGIQSEYAQTGMPAPEAWTADAVRRAASALGDELARTKLAGKQQEFLESRKHEAAETVRLEADLRERCRRLANAVGIEGVAGEGRLFNVIRDLHTWRSNQTNALAAEQELAAWHTKADKTIGLLNGTLARYSYAPVSDYVGAQAAVDELDKNNDVYAEARRDLKNAEAALAAAQKAAGSFRQELDARYAGLGVKSGNRRGVKDFVSKRRAYAAAVSERDEARTRLSDAKGAIQGSSEYEEEPLVALRTKLEDLGQKEGRAEQILEKMTQIKTKVDGAKQEHAIEERLAAEEQLADALRRKREEARAKVVGSVLAQHLRRLSADTGRPAVFHRAREILLGITRGRFRLDFEDGGAGGKPRFRATDTVTQRGRELGELSSGTKVQLLLAVRLAFIEQKEHGVMLPLTLDETLGNADDQRAHDIINAVVELARQGRQVFYLTAQSDEVDKWNEALVTHSDVECRIVRLSMEGRQFEAVPVEPIEVKRTPVARVPPPGDMTHDQYRAVINVPVFDPSQPSGRAHLWHLIEDTHVLHSLLAKSIDSWGRLSALMPVKEYNPIADDVAARKVIALGRGLETYLALWRQGRGRPVTEDVITESNALKKPIPKTVFSLLGKAQGEAKAFLDSLATSNLKSISEDAVASLRTYLVVTGYLNEGRKLTPDDIRGGVRKALRSNLTNGDLASEELERLFERLGRE